MSNPTETDLDHGLEVAESSSAQDRKKEARLFAAGPLIGELGRWMHADVERAGLGCKRRAAGAGAL